MSKPGDDRQPPPSALFKTLCVIRCTRSSGPCGRLQCDQGSMCPGGELKPWDQKIVEALNTKLRFGPGYTVAVQCCGRVPPTQAVPSAITSSPCKSCGGSP